MKFIHVTSPVKVSKDRDLFFAQPVTFETFKIAKAYAHPSLSIKQCAVQFEEDREVVPDHITILDNLLESIQDVGDFAFKFPFLKEILDVTYNHSLDCDYIIYSNVDISLMPYFYNSVFRLVNLGHDAIIINRRSIPARYRNIEELPLMWAEVGESHLGWDCFIFKRDLYPKFNLEKGVIGAVSSGRIMRYNLMFHAENFLELKRAHLTFHLGFSPTTTRQYSEKKWIKANIYNDEELKKILNKMKNSKEGKDLRWLHKKLENIKRRRRKYHEGLHGANRCPGYWRLKKLLRLLGWRGSIDFLKSGFDNL